MKLATAVCCHVSPRFTLAIQSETNWHLLSPSFQIAISGRCLSDCVIDCHRRSSSPHTAGYDNLLRKNLFRSLVRVFSCFSFETFTNSLLPLPYKIKLNPDLSLTPGGNSVEFSKHFRLSDESDRFSINVFIVHFFIIVR
jgi:hypothetical protein